jgi:hypothetical protein
LAELVRAIRLQGLPIERVDCGGGLGIAYRDEIAPAPAALAGAIKAELGALGLPVMLEPGRWIAGPAGVLLSLASGLPALVLGNAYMTHLWASLPLGFTEVKVSTVLLFDVGVFAAVWGALGGLCAQMVGLDEEGGA